MRTPIKAELKEMLRRLKPPTFAAQHAAPQRAGRE